MAREVANTLIPGNESRMPELEAPVVNPPSTVKPVGAVPVARGNFLRPMYLVPHRLTPRSGIVASATSPTSERNSAASHLAMRSKTGSTPNAKSMPDDIEDARFPNAWPRSCYRSRDDNNYGRVMMRAGTLLTLTAIAMLGLSACNKAESPAKVQDGCGKGH